MTKRHRYTAEDIQYIVDNYSTTRTKYIAEKIGVSRQAILVKACNLGLKKSQEIIRFEQLDTLALAHAKNRSNGYKIQKETTAPYLIKKGEYPFDKYGYTEDEKKALYKKRVESFKKTIASEKRRIKWGLEQKTKLKIGTISPAKQSFLSRMRYRGYIVTADRNTIWYDDNTKRGAVVERNAHKYNIRILQYNKQ